MRAVLARESEVHKLLTNERILGLDLLRGRKGTPEKPEQDRTDARRLPTVGTESETDPIPASVAALPHPGDVDHGHGPDEGDGQGDADTSGLPLFGEEEGGSTDEPTQ